MKFYFGPLRESRPLYDLTIYISGAEIICPRRTAVKLVPKIRLADLAEDDLQSVKFENFSVKNDEELKLATDILSEKPIWITFSNYEFLLNLAQVFEISELTTILNTYYKCHKYVDNKKIEEYIELHGSNSLLDAAASEDAQFVNSLIHTTKFNINQRDEETGIFFFQLTRDTNHNCR